MQHATHQLLSPGRELGRRMLAGSSISRAGNVFKDAGAAQFIAAASTIESIPALEGLPEVCSHNSDFAPVLC